MPGRFPDAVIAPILGAGFSFSTEWGSLLAILILLAIQTALAYRRGKVEPLPPSGSGGEESPAPIRGPRPEPSGEGTLRSIDRENGRPAPPSEEGESLVAGKSLFSEERRCPVAAAVSLGPPGPTRAKKPSRVFLRRLRDPIGAREAFLGAEILWNPPVALREPGNAGI
ncbi:hypothetical protein MAMC_00801 [Methylacidimicrobium cyclopophantes]|uniref:Uncharacterized protein n=1 Tax=Methylacidimicrobium cyclopophantes TaxID=1041766 RepID=A0A5E6M8V4_9BACT|nr:hypothetical protein MAMC_00801 [Methylacidimicrobium cyclopophantes]